MNCYHFNCYNYQHFTSLLCPVL
uniref:Uncharacterized protein n=1 Tax=Anguilla anguilla TaxID=7936 RepID=A0A0E9Q4D6_ANGAN